MNTYNIRFYILFYFIFLLLLQSGQVQAFYLHSSSSNSILSYLFYTLLSYSRPLI